MDYFSVCSSWFLFLFCFVFGGTCENWNVLQQLEICRSLQISTELKVNSGNCVHLAVVIFPFLVHVSIIRIYVISCVCPASWQSGWPVVHPSCMVESLMLAITCKLFNQIFQSCHTYGHHWLLPFNTAFNDLDLAWGSQGYHKAKPIALIFAHRFHLIRMTFVVVMKRFKLNILRLRLNKIYWNKGNNCCFIDCMK